tara:strand:- start:24 stop:362 length:339 start_codon:yes stop_codon:yes gene_type:complete
LHIADTIFESKIATYIPGKINGKTANCASACTFIFFAGNPRLAKGTVAVHRFATDFEAFLTADGLKKISEANLKHGKYTKDKLEAQRYAAQVGRRVLAKLKRIEQYLTTPSF